MGIDFKKKQNKNPTKKNPTKQTTTQKQPQTDIKTYNSVWISGTF